jgi:hypothetical protein
VDVMAWSCCNMLALYLGISINVEKKVR